MAKMGKLTPEEEARNKMLMRERDRERKRMKRMNPEYRKLEQERDRDRKKARRSNEAFRQLEKLRDKLRKERKKGIIVNNSLPSEFLIRSQAAVKSKIITNDNLTTTTQGNNTNNGVSGMPNNNNNNESTPITSAHTSGTHVPHVNKGFIYSPPGFAHHHLPIAGVTLMPQLCHPILHQNITATLYPANSIKQEYIQSEISRHPPSNSSVQMPPTSGASGNTVGQEQDSILHQNISATLYPPNGIKEEFACETPRQRQSNQMASGNSGSGNTAGEDQDVALIEPEIILQTSTDIISAPHHFNNHAYTHHLHQQQCSMFQHMTSQAHMSHMRLSHAHVQQTAPTLSQTSQPQ